MKTRMKIASAGAALALAMPVAAVATSTGADAAAACASVAEFNALKKGMTVKTAEKTLSSKVLSSQTAGTSQLREYAVCGSTPGGGRVRFYGTFTSGKLSQRTITYGQF